MFHQPTVIILGAGASIPYHYPSGPDLKTCIVDSIFSPTGAPTETQEMAALRREAGFSDKKFEFFQQEFLQSPTTIDEFLRWNERFQEIGKFVIAQRLLEIEYRQNVFRPNRSEGDWYGLFFSEMAHDPAQMKDNKLTIATFNYDRSFEHSLFTSIKSTYNNLPDGKVAALLSHIEIIHLHGDLGLLPWSMESDRATPVEALFSGQQLKPIPRYPYGSQPSVERIKFAAEQIKVIHESSDDDEGFVKTRQRLQEAKYIFLWGMDYHSVNLSRLGFSRPDREKIMGDVSGTNVRLPSRKVTAVADLKINLFGGNIREFIEQVGSFSVAMHPS